MLGSGISLIWCNFYSCLLSKWLFAEKFSSCSNSLNFEAKINCNTSKPNVPKWRKTCTGLQFYVVHFNGSQSHLLSGGNLWGPCTLAFNCGGHPSWKTIDFTEWPVCVGARQQERGTRAGGAQWNCNYPQQAALPLVIVQLSGQLAR